MSKEYGVSKLGAMIGMILLMAAGASIAQTEGMLYVEFRAQQASSTGAIESPRRLWVARDKYMRLEQPPDSVAKVQPLLIVAEPNVWAINAWVGEGVHFVDPGPTYKVRPMIFGTTSIAKLRGLEFGREAEFFDSYELERLPLRTIDSAICFGFRITVDSAVVMLYSDSTTGVPKRLALVTGRDTTTIIYDKYEYDLPVDTLLFRPPAGCLIRMKK